ncbi:hypothetical protein CRG98_002623 [Punica granatum]|uniref:DUF868 domain-containing protein n=1 Tax=Punica granatum TaxID=22663 RepID=A0A2I0L8Y8_PUNGR|nr:hypothetical protein CRG98_002623 [Punica granatum]
MHDSLGIPACFSGERHGTDPIPAMATSSAVYRMEISGQSCLVTVTWCKDLLLHGLSIAFHGPGKPDEECACKLELKPWHFWKRQGSKDLLVEGTKVSAVWDLRAVVFNGETEPRSDYYVAVVCKEEVVLLVGDMKKEAYRRTGCRPALTDPVLVSRTEHSFGKSRFFARIKIHEKGKVHQVSVMEGKSICNMGSESHGEPEMEIAIDGVKVAHVKHLQWKFRGNEEMSIGGRRLEVYWDVHDWLFGSGPRRGLFLFRPVIGPRILSPSTVEEPRYPLLASFLSGSALSEEEDTYRVHEDWASGKGTSDFCLFMYAWKID